MFEIPPAVEKLHALNKSQIIRMERQAGAFESAGKWREDRKLRLSGSARL